MGKNNTKKVILWVVLIFIFSILIIPASALVVSSLISDNNNNPLFIFNLTETISIYDMLLLYFTIVTMGVTALLTWAIFAFSQKKEHDEGNKKRMWIYSEILFLLNQIFQHRRKNLSAFTLNNDWMAHVCYCHEFLSYEQYSKLLEFYGKCDRLMVATYASQNTKSLAEDILADVLLPFYTVYNDFINTDYISDISILLHSDYIDILNAIYPSKKNILSFNNHAKYNNGKNIYKFNEHKLVYTVWNSDGLRLCEATFKGSQIWTGYAEYNITGCALYKGYFVDGKKDGLGIEQFQPYRLGTTSQREGIWKDDYLLNGKIQDFPAGNNGKNVKDVMPDLYSQNTIIAEYDVINGILCNEKTRVIS